MSLSDLENQAIGMLCIMPERTPETIRTTLRTLLGLFPKIQKEVTGEQLEECARRIETKLFVRMHDAASIQLQFKEWLVHGAILRFPPAISNFKLENFAP